MKILLVAPAWIGDTVLAQPLLARLHQRIPNLLIDALAPRWVAPVLGRMAEIRHCINSPFQHGQLDLGARRQLGRQLAQESYDAAIVLPNSLKSALVPFFAGIPVRAGFTGEARYGLLNRRLKLDPTALPTMAERFAALADFWPASGSQTLSMPQLQTSPAQQAQTLAALGLQRPAKLVIFCPGAEYGPAKRWPSRHFAALAQTLAAAGTAIWLLGSAKDRPIGEEITAQAPHTCRNLCGETTLEQAVDLLAVADAVVCNDSGLMHVAAAVGTPLCAVYGSSSPGFTPPLSPRATILSLGLDCSPCFKRECPLGHLHCLENLAIDQVLNSLPETLR